MCVCVCVCVYRWIDIGRKILLCIYLAWSMESLIPVID